MQKNEFENDELSIIINEENEVRLENLLSKKFNSEILLSKLKTGDSLAFTVEKINSNEAVIRFIYSFSINLVCDKYTLLKKRNPSLNIEDFDGNTIVSKYRENNSVIKESYKHNEKLDCTKYKILNICSWFVDEFIKQKEKLKWFANIKYIVIHSHLFFKDIMQVYPVFNKYRYIYIRAQGFEEHWNQRIGSNPFYNKQEFHELGYSKWAATIDSNCEVVGFPLNNENVIILKNFIYWQFISTFEIILKVEGWMLVKFYNLYWQVELCYRKKSKFESNLMNRQEFIDCIKHNSDDLLFLVDQRSILKIMPFKFKDILNLSLINWKDIILNFDDRIIDIDIDSNKIIKFWKEMKKKWFIEVFTSKIVVEKIWRNNDIWTAIRSNPIKKLWIKDICNIEISKDWMLISLNSTNYSYYLTKDMNVAHIKDSNGEEIKDSFYEEYIYNEKTYKWLTQINIACILFRNN